MRTASLTPYLAVVLIVSGCAAPEATPTAAPATPTTQAPAPEPTATIETGSIAGTVVDDESLPVPGASVALIEEGVQTTTDDSGAFTFNDLNPGTHTVAVERVGFEPTAKKVEVAAGEVAEAKLQLKPITIPDEAYTIAIPKTAMFHYGARVANFVLSVVNHSAINQYTCDPCAFVLHFPLKPKQAMTETYWTSTSPVPMTNAETYLYYKATWTTGAYLDGTIAHAAQYANRQGMRWATASVAETGKVHLLASGSYYGSIEHKIDIYTSFAYGAEFGDDYTRLPPP
ncbi:MAG TPA: carboxypeptidase-like regulatory domain-containing protein [Candidatus Thermoplasmatota archaeon]|nr:carboxypeptidase-like regulatory domain-containing protein [Candidatus Thermoplasmatota archaeon]